MLKNVLIVVDDIEKSIEFYKDLFGLQVILKNEGNVILSEGLVLQDADVWGKTLNETSTPFNNMMELYFEEFDIDGLIAALDKKIAKKRLIKQGAMQQLLTGKKRLPGFSGPWMERKLGAISHIKTGSCNGDQAVDNGKYPFFVRSQKVYAIDSYSYDGEAILVPGEGGIGSIFHYINGKFDYHQRVYKISDFADNVCGKYIFFYMSRYFGEYALFLTVKATVDSLRLPTFEEFVICMPLNIEEQQAIATILNDMDKEIDDLEAQRDKYRLLKSGMMQKLLTGQIRLKIK